MSLSGLSDNEVSPAILPKPRGFWGDLRHILPGWLISRRTPRAESSHGLASATIEPGPIDVPLVIDLDGTLLRTDALLESALKLAKERPLSMFQMPFWLWQGHAEFKQKLATLAPLAADTMPINEEVRAFAVSEHARGRKIYLATAADQSVADAIARSIPIFEGVVASQGSINMKGHVKADRLTSLFPNGFAYAGDSRADFPVWAQTSEIILVGHTLRTERVASHFGRPVRAFPTSSRWQALFEGMRPHQWAKNTLVFLPPVLGGAMSNAAAVTATTLAFIALCLVASATYLINDLWDVTDDRQHWSKRKRPIASGRLPIATAITAVPLTLACGLVIAGLVSHQVLLVIGFYLALTLSYSFWGKRIPMLDVSCLAGLFTTRIALGIVSSGVQPSPWLLIFSMFLFASLCFAKRYVEIVRSAALGRTSVNSRGYEAQDVPLVLAVGLGTGMTSIAIMVLYIIFDAFKRTFYGDTIWLWAMPLIMFLWICRIWLMAVRDKLNDDPVAFALRDPPSLGLGGTMCAAFLLAWSGVFT